MGHGAWSKVHGEESHYDNMKVIIEDTIRKLG
jgi:hypothetical protein